MKNFGDLLDSIYSKASLQFANNKKDCSKILKECINTIKTDKVLSDQFTIFNNLKTSVIDENQINDYITENINSLKSYKHREIIRSNNKLERICSKLGTKVKKDKLNESISKLCFLMNTAKNVNVLHESKNIIKENLLTNQKKKESDVPSIPLALMSKLVSKKYNEKYSTLNESDKKLLRVILENKEGDEKLFKLYKEKATQLLKVKIVENDDSTLHTNLKKSYKKITEMEYINESLINDVSKLHQLIEGLE
tara:strand:+ start:1980 stop:2735 length:756 start_codon:yes stop_codon:yes gene_type:complete